MKAHAQCNLSAIITVVYMSFNLNLKKKNTPELKITGYLMINVHMCMLFQELFSNLNYKKKKKKNKKRNR